MLDNLPGIAGMLEKAQRQQRIDDDYDDYERTCRDDVIKERQSVMGQEIYEDPHGEGTRSLLWIWEEEIEHEVTARVSERRLRDAMEEDQ